MTTYKIINDCKKYDSILKKIRTTAKQTKAKIIEMAEETHEKIYDNYEEAKPEIKQYLVTRIVVQ